jgi:ribosomal protein S18 acetylase RimI-like enzyme
MPILAIAIDWIFKPAVGALALWVWNISKRKYNNYEFRKKYALSGPYMAYATGEREQKPVTEKELLDLHQSVSKVTGTATTLVPKRDWIIKTEILDNGWLSGVYKAVHDGSLGTFFLEQEAGRTDRFKGFWSGYDSMVHMVRCGEYEWRKLLQFAVKPIKTDSHLKDKALAILSVNLGKRYVTDAEFQEYLDGKEGRVFGAFLDDKLIGVALARIWKKDDPTFYEKACGKAGFLSAHGRMGHLKSAAVTDAYQSKGAGTSLCKAAIQYFREAGCNAVFTVAWESGQPQSSLSMLQGLGFKSFAEVPDFWKVSDPQQDHQCPRCGFPCKCIATFCLLIC